MDVLILSGLNQFFGKKQFTTDNACCSGEQLQCTFFEPGCDQWIFFRRIHWLCHPRSCCLILFTWFLHLMGPKHPKQQITDSWKRADLMHWESFCQVYVFLNVFWVECFKYFTQTLGRDSWNHPAKHTFPASIGHGAVCTLKLRHVQGGHWSRFSRGCCLYLLSQRNWGVNRHTVQIAVSMKVGSKRNATKSW